jgi:hypothetical protein
VSRHGVDGAASLLIGRRRCAPFAKAVVAIERANSLRLPKTAIARMTKPMPVRNSAIPTTMLKYDSISDM